MSHMASLLRDVSAQTSCKKPSVREGGRPSFMAIHRSNERVIALCEA